ncbi:RNA polymerase sigma factor [Lentzea sp. NPDC058436]|uniref:RNA polymerase sigma factor n=1 Tax=Lentzea sp. NPDC058436 TaxID=3346499 RepID=UPI00365E4C5F
MTSSPARLADERLASLVEATRAGNKGALNEIVREFTPMLCHVARAQGADRESTADVVQHMAHAYRRTGRNSHPTALVAWLVTVTKREAWRIVRERGSKLLVDDTALVHQPDDAPGPEELAVSRDLWQSVRQLSVRCQQLSRIVAFVRRPDYNQISAALGMPRGTIGPARGRCLAQLSGLIGDSDG